jgi:NAD(P)-dependent dehydrogenase (short-subunit alcohol dehydrogenase family)
MTDLSGHVALVTGGNSGIGLGMASGLARAGASVAIWGRNPDKNAAAGEQLAAIGGGKVHVEQCDVSDEAQILESMASTVAALGRVDSVFANAGVSGSGASFLDMTLEEWRRVTAINLDGAFLTMREGARHMVARGGGGAIVAVSSVSAIHGAPNSTNYAAAKTGLLGLIRAMAVGLARYGIRCNSLLPGWTDTDLTAGGKANPKFLSATVGRTPVRRWAQPSEFEEVAVFLADPSLTFHTGETMVVDGGYSIF